MSVPPCPPAFEAEVERLRRAALARIDEIPVAVLVWGPSPTGGSPTAATRLKLKQELQNRGHLARFSEELFDSTSIRSNLAQQIAQAEAHDIVFSIPDSPGSIAEIHDFARIPWLSHKVVTFLDQKWNDGYSNQSLIQLQAITTCQVRLYDSSALPTCVVECALEQVGRLQELFYMAGRRF